MRLQEYPGLPDTSAATRNAMFAHWDTLDEDYAAQQRTPYIEAEARVDRRVHAVVYCLPQHERLRAGDAAAMRRLFAAKPGFPVMFQVCNFAWRTWKLLLRGARQEACR